MKQFFARLFRREKARTPFCSAVVAAGGSSSRMGGGNKLMMPIEGVPVLMRTLLALENTELVNEIVVAVREEDLLQVADLCKAYGLQKPLKIVRGGSSRTESVLAAALECREDAAYIAVHDGARPLAEPSLIDSVIRRCYETNAAAPAVPVKDTIRVVRDGRVVETPPRDTLFAVQTPQVFDAQLLRAALQAAAKDGADVTDDCSAVERLGKEIYLTDGSWENIKITTPEDLLTASVIIQKREGRL